VTVPGMNDLQAYALFTEAEIEYRHIGNLVRVADFDVLSVSGESLAIVREELKSWRRLVPAGALEALISRTLIFLSPSGETVMRCVRPRHFGGARIELHLPGVGDVIGLDEVHAARRTRFVISGPSRIGEGAVEAERPKDRLYSVFDHDGRAVAKVWMTSGQTRGPLTYRLVLSRPCPSGFALLLLASFLGFMPPEGGRSCLYLGSPERCRARRHGELQIDLEEDKVARAVVFGLLKTRDEHR
jgi:hypothetical protein